MASLSMVIGDSSFVIQGGANRGTGAKDIPIRAAPQQRRAPRFPGVDVSLNGVKGLGWGEVA